MERSAEQDFQGPETPMIADTLHRLNAERKLEASEMADLLNLAQCSPYRYYADTDLRLGQYRTLVRHCRNRDAAHDLIQSVVAGTEFYVMRMPRDLDLDGDGDVDTDDAIAGAIAANLKLAELLRSLHGLQSNDVVEVEDADRLEQAVGRLISKLGSVQKIIADAADRRRRKRKAHAFTHTGVDA